MRAKAAFPSFQDLSSSRPALIVPLVLAILALAACGSPTSGSDDSSTSSDTGSNNTTTTNDVSFTANSGDRRVTLTDWGDSDSVDIYWSTDPGCDWSSYTTCDDSGMLSGEDVSSEGAEVVITVAGDGLRADEPHFFVAEPAGGSARYRSDVAGARPFIYHLNGNVYSSVEMGDYVYVGGDFTRQHVSTGGGLAVAADDGTTVDSLPLVDGSIEAVQADGSGGWFIGGDFGRVAGQSRRNLAHVNALGQVTDWNPGIPGGQVKALELHGESDTLYVGGDFVLNEGESNERRDLAAFATTGSGALRGWRPRVGPEEDEDVAVHALAIGGDSIYVGGTFTKVYDENDGFASQSRLAAFDLQEGKRRSGWANPGVGDGDPTTVVHALLHIPADRIANQDDGVVLVGGNFTSAGVNEGDRDNAAVYRDVQGGGGLLGTEDLNVTTFNGDVRDVRLHGDYVYTVGDFDEVTVDDGTTTTTERPGIAAIHLKAADDDSYHPGDLVTTWTPDSDIASNRVHSLSILGDVEDGTPMFFLAGDFRFPSGDVTIANAMALDADGDLVTAWNPAPNREARAVAAQDLEDGARVYLGGIFNRAAGESHEYLMANEVDTGRLVWPEGSPAPNGSVLALAGNAAEDTLFLGGTFGDLGGDAYLSALSLDTDTEGELVDITHDDEHFDVSPDAPVLTLLADDTDNLYVGGAFGSIGGNAHSHSRLALFDNSGGLDAWDPALADGPVWSLAHDGTNKVLYAGGAFASADGDRLLGFDTDDDHAAVSLPEPNQPVYAMEWNDDRLYIGGEFTDVNDDNTKQRLAAVDTTDNSLLSAWAPSIGDGYSRDQVSAIAHHNGTIFVGGSFNELDGEPRQNVAALNDKGAVLNNWFGDTNGAIQTLSTGSNADGPVLFLGGSFGTVRNEPFSRFTAIGIDYDELIWAPR